MFQADFFFKKKKLFRHHFVNFVLIFHSLHFQHVSTIDSDWDRSQGYTTVHDSIPLQAMSGRGDPQGSTTCILGPKAERRVTVCSGQKKNCSDGGQTSSWKRRSLGGMYRAVQQEKQGGGSQARRVSEYQ